MPVSWKYSSRALATSMTAVACPRPMPFCSRVMQMEPPPMPIFTKSAPALARKRKPSRSTTLPAPTFTASPYFWRIHWMVRLCHSEKPSEESMHSTSTPASRRAGTRSS